MAFNQASVNIERGKVAGRGEGGGAGVFYIVHWPFRVCYLQEIGKMLSVFQPF